ncbi:MAG TPA: hypothetical protein VIU11_16290 [Nakamurella sp.]
MVSAPFESANQIRQQRRLRAQIAQQRPNLSSEQHSVRLERFAHDDPDGRELTHQLRFRGPGRFSLHHTVDGVPVGDIVRRDVLDDVPEPSMNGVSRTGGVAAWVLGGPGMSPPRCVSPGTYREMRNPLRIASTGRRGSLSTKKARPRATTRVVLAWEARKPLSGNGPSQPGPTAR